MSSLFCAFFYSSFLNTLAILSNIAFKYPICIFSKKCSEANKYSLIITFLGVLGLNISSKIDANRIILRAKSDSIILYYDFRSPGVGGRFWNGAGVALRIHNQSQEFSNNCNSELTNENISIITKDIHIQRRVFKNCIYSILWAYLF